MIIAISQEIEGVLNAFGESKNFVKNRLKLLKF